MTKKNRQLLNEKSRFILLIYFIVFVAILISVNANATEKVIIPKLIFDKSVYTHGDTVQMGLVLGNVNQGDCTNSVTFDIRYNSSAFQLETGNFENDIVEGYINFTKRN